MNGPSFSSLDLHMLSQLKGQVLAFDLVLDTKEFMSELLIKESPFSELPLGESDETE